MEIRLKLTLQFLVLVALLLVAILGFNYYLAWRFAFESFENRLKERGLALAEFHLEQNPATANRLDELNRKNNQTLKGEALLILEKSGKVRFRRDAADYAIEADLVRKKNIQPETPVLENDRMVIWTSLQENDQVYDVVISARDEVGQSKLRNQLQSMVLSFVFFLVLIVLAGQYLAGKALEPIKSVISQVTPITAENLSNRVQYANEKDEIAQLAITFNHMLDRLEVAFKSQSAFVSHASHELRNPLAAMIGQAEIALKKERDTLYYIETLRVILDESLRLKEIVNSLLELSMASQAAVLVDAPGVRLDDLLLDVVENLGQIKGYHQIHVELPQSDGTEPIVPGSRQLLEIGIRNLIDNACKYSSGKPVHCSLTPGPGYWSIRIQDQGIGIEESELRYVSQLFFRSERARRKEGFGIGMAVATKVFDLHQVPMDIVSQPGKGTTVLLKFPFPQEQNRR